MAETNGLLNRRTGKSGTEGSNPSVSATHLNISNACVESLGLPDLTPLGWRPLFWLMGPTVPSYILFGSPVSCVSFTAFVVTVSI